MQTYQLGDGSRGGGRGDGILLRPEMELPRPSGKRRRASWRRATLPAWRGGAARRRGDEERRRRGVSSWRSDLEETLIKTGHGSDLEDPHFSLCLTDL